MNYKVQESISEIKIYNNLLLHDQSTLFYQSIPYHNLLKEHLNCESIYFLAYEDDRLVGTLPFLYKESEYGSIFNSLPYYGSNGGFIIDKNLEIDKQNEIKNNLYNQYLEFAKSKNVLSSTIITNPLKNDKEYIENELKLNATDYRIGQITELPEKVEDLEDLMKIFNKKTRNVIRKSIKNDVNVLIDNSKINTLYKIHKENMESIGGKPKSKDFFDFIPKYFKIGIDYNIYIAKYENQIISALLVFYYNKTVEYFTPVVVKEFRSLNALSHIIATAMKDSIDKKYNYWNWGGTWESQKGVYEFKKEWGTEDYKYYYYTSIFDEKIKSIDSNSLKNKFESFYLYRY